MQIHNINNRKKEAAQEHRNCCRKSIWQDLISIYDQSSWHTRNRRQLPWCDKEPLEKIYNILNNKDCMLCPQNKTRSIHHHTGRSSQCNKTRNKRVMIRKCKVLIFFTNYIFVFILCLREFSTKLLEITQVVLFLIWGQYLKFYFFIKQIENWNTKLYYLE